MYLPHPQPPQLPPAPVKTGRAGCDKPWDSGSHSCESNSIPDVPRLYQRLAPRPCNHAGCALWHTHMGGRYHQKHPAQPSAEDQAWPTDDTTLADCAALEVQLQDLASRGESQGGHVLMRASEEETVPGPDGCRPPLAAAAIGTVLEVCDRTAQISPLPPKNTTDSVGTDVRPSRAQRQAHLQPALPAGDGARAAALELRP